MWACSTVMLHHIVITALVVTLPFAHPQSFWSSISTCYLPCEQSLTVAQVLGPSLSLLLDPVECSGHPGHHCHPLLLSNCPHICPFHHSPCPCPCCCSVFVLVLLSSLSSVVPLLPLLSTCDPPCEQGLTAVCNGYWVSFSSCHRHQQF